MHRLVGEHARLRGVLPGEVELGADIAGDRLGRLALRVELVERAVPLADQVADDRPVDRLLRAEIVVDIGLGQAGPLGDLGDARAVITLRGEHADRRREDRRLVAGGDAGIGADAAIGGRSLRHLASLSGEPAPADCCRPAGRFQPKSGRQRQVGARQKLTPSSSSGYARRVFRREADGTGARSGDARDPRRVAGGPRPGLARRDRRRRARL